MMIVSFNDSEESVINRVSSVLTRAGFQNISPLKDEILSFSDLKICIKEQRVFIGDKSIPLSRYEFLTLVYLASHPNWVLSKEQIYEAVWNVQGNLCGSAVTNVISQIRRKLREGGANQDYIQTVVGSGYRFSQV